MFAILVLKASSPVSTELEVIVLDWVAKMLGLPEFFYSSSANGGGVIQVHVLNPENIYYPIFILP